jgi:protein-S-isoprenylcysteine O-methyltransferase Ste14
LLKRRVHAGPLAEPTATPRAIQSLAGLAFCAIFVVSALTRVAPVWVSTIGLALVACGFWVVFRVFRVNTFTAGTVEVARDQSVVDTGPYAIVRHPMYSGALLVLVGTPLALGSWWGLVTVPFIGAAVIARLLDEERQLARDLTGYDAYCGRVRWRLAPGVY